jgi:Ca2+-binding RTX toxin-like protein
MAPTDGATDVAATSNAEVTFSEAMDSSTINGSTFTLVKQGTSQPVAAQVTYDPVAKRATLDPDADLDPSATYTAAVKGGTSGVKDPAGNPLAQDTTWSFATAAAPPPTDTTPPETTIDSGPSETITVDSATFAFSSSEAGATFECSLDGEAYSACTSPKDYTNLPNGSHTFEVRATDEVGNVDATPASRTFAVEVTPPPPDDTTPPETTIDSGPSGTLSSSSASFTFSSDEASSTFECKLDAGTFASCTSPQAYDGLSNGSHTFEVRATDAAGNSDATPASRTWTVDTTPPAPSCTITGTANAETISGTSGDDVICAGGGGDTIKGGGGNDILRGEGGADKLYGEGGDDTFDGGLGTDAANFSSSLAAITASLTSNTATGEGSDTLTAIENLVGSSKEDTLTGSEGNNFIDGGGLGDSVTGMGGADTLNGGGGPDSINSQDGVNGNDSLDGGPGTDTKTTDTTENSIVGFP